MHIETIRVQEFGTIDSLAVDLTDGLNVISGPNEAGKSTLMKAVWFALTRRCTSQAQEIREIEPNKGGIPRVEVCLQIDGTQYELKKVFNGQSGRVSLRVTHSEEGVEDYTGEEADEVIRNAVGFGEAGGRRGVPEHFGFWPTVWVGQEERQLDPGKHLTEDGNLESISSVLAEIGGDMLAGSGGEIVEMAREKYRDFYTESGKLTERSGAPLYKAKERKSNIKGSFQELKDKRERYEDDLDDHDRLQQKIASLGEQLPELRQEVGEAREKFQRVQALQNKLEGEKAKLEIVVRKVDQIENRLDRRKSLRANIEKFEEEKEEKGEEIARRKEALDTHRECRKELVEAKDQAERTHNELKRKERRLRTHLDVLRFQERLKSIEDRIDQLGDLIRTRRELTSEVAEITIEEDDIDRLESLKKDRDQAQIRLETAAAQLRFAAQSDIDVRVGDEDLSLTEGDEAHRRIDEPTIIAVDSHLQIRVEPGGEELASIREDARNAQRAYDDARSEINVESFTEARSQFQRKDRLETQLDSVKRQLAGLMPEGEEDLDEAKIQTEKAVEATKEKRRKHTEPARDDPLPAEEQTVRDRLDDLEVELEEVTGVVEQKHEAVQEHDSETQDLRAALQKAETQAEGIWKSLERARRDLQEHKKEYGPDEEVQEALAEAQGKLEERKEEVEELESELDDLNAVELEARKERIEGTLETMKREKDELVERLNKIRGRLEGEELRGLHSRLNEAEQKLKEARAEVDRLRQQAEAAKLLYETLTKTRAETRKKYHAPLREEVKELLDRFFDAEESSVEFGEKFDLQRLSRSSDGSFEFDQLSTGAKQQLSVLVRLSMARLIARDCSHPVFLDDTLSDTDPERFEAMANILRSVARDMQIILTTCHHNRHRRLGVETKRMNVLKGEAK